MPRIINAPSAAETATLQQSMQLLEQFQQAEPALNPDTSFDLINAALTAGEAGDAPAAAQNWATLLKQHMTSPGLGTAVTQAMLQQPDGMEITKAVGASLLQDEIMDPAMQPNAFLRNAHTVNGITAEVMEQKAQGYGHAVAQKATQAAGELNVAAVNATGTDGQKAETALLLGREIITALTETDIDPEARDFLQHMSQQMENNVAFDQHLQRRCVELEYPHPVTAQKMAATLVNNAVVLRVGGPAANQALGRGANPICTNAVGSAQKISSGFQGMGTVVIKQTGAQGNITMGLRDEKSAQQFHDMHARLNGRPTILEMQNMLQQIDRGAHMNRQQVKELNENIVKQMEKVGKWQAAAGINGGTDQEKKVGLQAVMDNETLDVPIRHAAGAALHEMGVLDGLREEKAMLVAANRDMTTQAGGISANLQAQSRALTTALHADHANWKQAVPDGKATVSQRPRSTPLSNQQQNHQAAAHRV